MLQKVQVRVVANTVCSEWYASQGKSIRVESKQMCAGWEEGRKDSCWVSKKAFYCHNSSFWVQNGRACALTFFFFFFAFAHRCSLGTACQSSDHGIHGSSDGCDANFNKYPRYRGNAHTMLFGHDSRPCRMISVPGNWIVYNCIGLALRISNVS